MTSVSQVIGGGSGSLAGFGLTNAFGRPEPRDRETDRTTLPGRDDPRDTSSRQAPSGGIPELPGRDTGRRATDVVRLPGQEAIGDSGPRRPLIAGGAFVLAVAIGLSLDEQTSPDAVEPATPSSTAGQAPQNQATGSEETDANGLTEAEQEQVRELKARDAEVRQHEAAHAAAGGQYAGSPTYTYQSGPDGRQYAVGGEVSIDTAPVRGNPEATIQKAQQIKAAAAAPADPSSQDRRVAAQADALRQQAQAELRAETAQETEEGTGTGDTPATGAAAQGVATTTPAGRSSAGEGSAGETPPASPVSNAAPIEPFAADQGSDQDDGADPQTAGSGFQAGSPAPGGEEDDGAFVPPVVFRGAVASYQHSSFAPNRVSISV